MMKFGPQGRVFQNSGRYLTNTLIVNPVPAQTAEDSGRIRRVPGLGVEPEASNVGGLKYRKLFLLASAFV
jgi:hypothetical protein